MSTENIPDAKMPEKVFAIYALRDESDPDSDTFFGCFPTRELANAAFLEVEATDSCDIVGVITLGVYEDLDQWRTEHADELEEEDDEPVGPEEDDWLIFDVGCLHSRTGVTQLGASKDWEFESREEAIRFIAHRMNDEDYRPNVWHQDDHGGTTLVLINADTGEEV